VNRVARILRHFQTLAFGRFTLSINVAISVPVKAP
jgi:hypothetical protein